MTIEARTGKNKKSKIPATSAGSSQAPEKPLERRAKVADLVGAKEYLYIVYSIQKPGGCQDISGKARRHWRAEIRRDFSFFYPGIPALFRQQGAKIIGLQKPMWYAKKKD